MIGPFVMTPGRRAVIALIILAAAAPRSFAAGWTPADTNTAFWYDASDASTIQTSGSTVTNWQDKSGNGKHLTTVLGDPTTGRSINGLNAIEFSADKIYMTNSHALKGNPDMMLACVVVYDTRVDKVDVVLAMGDGWHHGCVAIAGGREGYSWEANNPWERYGAVSTGSPVIQIGTRPSGTDFTACCMYTNGIESAATGLLEGYRKPNVQDGIAVGAGSWQYLTTKGKPMDGAIGEIIACKDDDPELRITIEGYLAHKWGLEANLPMDHPHKLRPPGVPAGMVIILR